MLENPRRRSGSTRSRSGLSYRHQIYRERDGSGWTWALFHKPVGQPWTLVTTGSATNEREAVELCTAAQEHDEAKRLARRNPSEGTMQNPGWHHSTKWVRQNPTVEVDERDMVVGRKRYRLVVHPSLSLFGFWVWSVYHKDDEGVLEMLDTGTVTSRSAARSTAERVAATGRPLLANPCHGNPENPEIPCQANPENPFPHFGHLVHVIGDLPWKKATHAAGFFVWWASIPTKRAKQLVQELVGKRLPRPGYEMNLGELPQEATLWIENTGGKYILKVL